MKIHEKYLSRCLEIAKNGLGTTAPNPMVGAVLVVDDHIVGEGYTSAFGGAHAEVNAIRSVTDPSLLTRATLYVSLEPCCHHGKTPPCTDLILEKGIPRVVLGIRDPHNAVAGKGIARLQAAGCEVTEGILEDACREHHRRFLCYHEKKRPYVILKWAQTPDGFIAPVPGKRAARPEPFWISSNASRLMVHKWRTQEQAILVGTRTALADNPSLTARAWKGKDPLRLVADRDLQIPRGFHLLDGTAPTLLFHSESRSPEAIPGVEFQALDFGAPLAGQILDQAYKRGILSILVEGGLQTLQSFLEAGLWDEARVFTGNVPLGEGVRAPDISGRTIAREHIGPDTLHYWRHD